MIQQVITVNCMGNVVVELPDNCPMCKAKISPKVFYSTPNENLYGDRSKGISVAMGCPACHKLFVAEYGEQMKDSYDTIIQIGPCIPASKQFDPQIKKVSPTFIEIYNQALAAECYNLSHIAGMGYRKSLEFLIKDYAKILDPDESETIEKMMLSPCIQKYIDHPKIKATATASVWLGNDETHYIRKFTDKDVEDLKRFINSCVYWILADYDASSAAELISK